MPKRILLVEDEEMVRVTISLLLSHNGYEVMTNSNGLNVISQIEHFKPDLILLDIMLGEIDGRDICKMLKQDPLTLNIPIIMVSGASYIYNTISEVGANDVLMKPFTENILLQRIERHFPNILSA